MIYFINFFLPATSISLQQNMYSVMEGEDSVMVCAEITRIPAGVLLCNITVVFEVREGLKASELTEVITFNIYCNILHLWSYR